MILNISMMFKLLSFSLFVTTVLAAQKTEYKFLGCFLEENLLTLGEESRVLTPVTPQSCSDFCSEKQYTFFILKQNTCHCSKNYISRLMRQLDFECSIKCSGDTSASCGGPPNLVSSYTTDKSKANNFIAHGGYPIPIYLGCYAETPNDDENRLLKGPAGPITYNTPQKCSVKCFNMGFLFFGVTYGTECWCGNQRPAKSSKVDDINCNTPCSGDSNQFCGGGWKMGIYSTGITDYIPKKYIGCFDDDGKKTKGKYLTFPMESNNSPKRCMNLCNTHRFKYAAIKGNICECKNYEPNFNLQRSFSDCNTLCTENPSEYCGGSTTISIYKTLYSDSLEKVSVNPIGCFTNSKRHPLLNGWKITHSRLTPKHCVYSCHIRRYPYAALISSRECLCSSTKPSDEAKTGDDMCTTPCSGSSEYTCGGNNGINVYSSGLEWKTDTIGHNYLGCYEENQNNRIFNGYSRSYSVNTPEFCSSLCYKFGYTYFGVTYKSECFCGNQSPNEPKFPKVEDKQCNTKCTGDANQFCGGGWRMGVFSTGLIDFDVNNRLVGCFEMAENSFGNIKFELLNTNTPSKCSAICYNSGYTFSGVSGINCYCGVRAPSPELYVENSDCDTPCVGDSTKTCGGEVTLQIYDIITINHTNKNETIPELVDEFNTLNLESIWSYDIYIAQEPDFAFVIYNNSEKNLFVKNGELVIKPTVLSDNYVKNGCLQLKGCTQYEESSACSMNASSFNILPPIVSSRLITKHHKSLQHGHLKVIAKFPTGDWIVPEIALVSTTNEQNKLVLGTSSGNIDLKCNGVDESISVLKYGLKVDELYHSKSIMMKSISASRWSDDYHTLELSWSNNNILFKIDGESHPLDTSNLQLNLIFDSEYYVSIGVSVGGMKNFPDGCLSNNRLKPWKNFDTKAMLNFWKDRNQWISTWDDEKSTLKVKSIKFTEEDNINI
ncbi:uncharacterized protein LOC132929522 [Rhopalosiphum padi]|uniref:uncharacterized protein LOC132929522 n=1 Tax=Rhopalosiphum padi TaxID=40932 RepID=UPI00298DE018|nr:uncharacterized protein LOC132929522 [Rhopalosiphum padi]